MRDVNGMTIGVATDPVMDGRKSMLAVGMNGQLLPQEHGYPVRVVIPGLYGYVSATKWVVDMELTTFGAFNAYWVKQRLVPAGADQDRVPHRRAEAPQHRGRGPGRRSPAWPGRSTPASRASRWASTASGTRRNSPRRTPSTPGGSGTTSGTLPPGMHTLQVRATDQTGYTQTARRAPDRAQRRDRIPHHPGHTWPEVLIRPADGAHPLCAPAAYLGPADRRPTRAGGQRARSAASRSSSASRLCALTTASQYGHAAAMPPTSGRYRGDWVRGIRPHDPVRDPGQPRHLRAEQLRIAGLPAVGDDQDDRAPGHAAAAVAVVELLDRGADPGSAGPVGRRLARLGQHRVRAGRGQRRRQPGQPGGEAEHLGPVLPAARPGRR